VFVTTITSYDNELIFRLKVSFIKCVWHVLVACPAFRQRPVKYAIMYVVNHYSTKQVANMAGINRVTLQRWLLAGKLAEPRRMTEGGVDARLWTERDIARVKKFKEANYCKGRGRKKKS